MQEMYEEDSIRVTCGKPDQFHGIPVGLFARISDSHVYEQKW